MNDFTDLNRQAKLKPAVKELWLKALRSGEYKQGDSKLKKRNYGGTVQHCCLGVLCDIAAEQGAVSFRYASSSAASGVDFEGLWMFGEDKDHLLLPKEVTEWAFEKDTGVDKWLNRNPMVEYRSQAHGLSELNDTYHLPFTEIADVIEVQL